MTSPPAATGAGTSRRLAAVLALVGLIGGIVLVGLAVAHAMPWALVVVAALALAAVAGWQGLIREGRARVTSWIVAVILVVGAISWLLADGLQWIGLLGVALLLLAIPAAKHAFSVHVRLPAAAAPARPVVVYNVKSGGGKAVRFNLAEEARKRGITPREFQPGEDWEQVVRDLVEQGADGLMAAGGDGTQALVATIAAEHDLPFACIPAGTRNHFALDLGVDRDDVVGALDAFVNGGEKRVDLGDIAGRVFVNNVSLGVYAESVQQEGYRDAKIRTILQTAPAALSQSGEGGGRDLRWTGPDGATHHAAAVVLVSNNVYRLGRAIGSGTRPRMDDGTLGIAVMGALDPSGHRRALTQWRTSQFVIESDADIPVGVDGEAMTMPTPLTFRIRPGALRVRIAPQHPGASPSAGQPSGVVDALRGLLRIAAGGSVDR